MAKINKIKFCQRCKYFTFLPFFYGQLHLCNFQEYYYTIYQILIKIQGVEFIEISEINPLIWLDRKIVAISLVSQSCFSCVH